MTPIGLRRRPEALASLASHARFVLHQVLSGLSVPPWWPLNAFAVPPSSWQTEPGGIFRTLATRGSSGGSSSNSGIDGTQCSSRQNRPNARPPSQNASPSPPVQPLKLSQSDRELLLPRISSGGCEQAGASPTTGIDRSTASSRSRTERKGPAVDRAAGGWATASQRARGGAHGCPYHSSIGCACDRQSKSAAACGSFDNSPVSSHAIGS